MPITHRNPLSPALRTGGVLSDESAGVHVQAYMAYLETEKQHLPMTFILVKDIAEHAGIWMQASVDMSEVERRRAHEIGLGAFLTYARKTDPKAEMSEFLFGANRPQLRLADTEQWARLVALVVCGFAVRVDIT